MNLNSFRVIKEEKRVEKYSYQQHMQKDKLLSDVPTSSGVHDLCQRQQGLNNNSRTSTANCNDYFSFLVLTSTVSKGVKSIVKKVNLLHNGDLGSRINGMKMTWSGMSAPNSDSVYDIYKMSMCLQIDRFKNHLIIIW